MHTDVTTTYLGLSLTSPLIVGACPLTLKPESVREMAVAGAGAVVLPSLLEEQIVRKMMDRGDHFSATEKEVEQSGLPLREDGYNGGVDSYLRTVSMLKRSTGIPVIANINGCSGGTWLNFARELEERGADAIEFSFQAPSSDPLMNAETIESNLIRAVESVVDSVSIPVSIKLLPYFTSLPNLIWRLTEVGAAGVVLFGREPVWEVRDSELQPTYLWPLSDCGQLHATLSGLIRSRACRSEISIAASGGIASAKDVIHGIIAGCDTAMVTSAIYRNGFDVIAHILEGVIHYLERKNLRSYDEFVAVTRRANAAPRTITTERQSRISPMTSSEDQRAPTQDPARKSGDRWGHVLPAKD